MADYFNRRDISTVTAFTDPLAKFTFEFEAAEQAIVNESSDTVFELSFDGTNVHGRLDPKNETKTINWVDHVRRLLYVRRVPDTGGQGAKYVQVYGMTR